MFNPADPLLADNRKIKTYHHTAPKCETTLNTERSTHHTLILEASEIETLLPFVVKPILAGHCQLMNKCEVLHGDVFQRGLHSGTSIATRIEKTPITLWKRRSNRYCQHCPNGEPDKQSWHKFLLQHVLQTFKQVTEKQCPVQKQPVVAGQCHLWGARCLGIDWNCSQRS